ncbi:hypothetical protein, partial [Demequina muriae]
LVYGDTAPPAQPAERVHSHTGLLRECAYLIGNVIDSEEPGTYEGADELLAELRRVIAATPAPSEGGNGVDGYVAFTCEEVREAYVCLRKYNCTIPDECLDQMRAVLLTAAQQATP